MVEFSIFFVFIYIFQMSNFIVLFVEVMRKIFYKIILGNGKS